MSCSQEFPTPDDPTLVAEVEHVPEAAAHVITELEQRIRVLEDRLQRCEAERDELTVACRDAKDGRRDAEASLRAREEILAVIAHDLRNPLGTIVMGATALLQVGAPAEKAQWMRTVAERMHRQAERMAEQLGNLADFAEIQMGRLAIAPAPHAPRAILAAASEIFGPIARERGITFETRVSADLPDVACDADRVVRVLSNLLANALKVTTRGGVIEAGAEARDDQQDGQQIVFFVRDKGPGVDHDELGAMFQPLWRSKHPSYQNTWLGFSIARGIVDAHGGRIWADSAPGAGTTVYFSLTPRIDPR